MDGTGRKARQEIPNPLAGRACWVELEGIRFGGVGWSRVLAQGWGGEKGRGFRRGGRELESEAASPAYRVPSGRRR
jgi:hypothetical protein